MRSPQLPLLVAVLCGALALAGCGARQSSGGPLRVVSLELTPSVDFPGPPTRQLILTQGAQFVRIARLVPLPLPHEIEVNPHGTRHPLTVCFPMDLVIGLSDGSKAVFSSCYRPRSLRPVVAALCPLVGIRGLCVRYRHELGGAALPVGAGVRPGLGHDRDQRPDVDVGPDDGGGRDRCLDAAEALREAVGRRG